MVQPCGERQERGARATERWHAHAALHELQPSFSCVSKKKFLGDARNGAPDFRGIYVLARSRDHHMAMLLGLTEVLLDKIKEGLDATGLVKLASTSHACRENAWIQATLEEFVGKKVAALSVSGNTELEEWDRYENSAALSAAKEARAEGAKELAALLMKTTTPTSSITLCGVALPIRSLKGTAHDPVESEHSKKLDNFNSLKAAKEGGSVFMTDEQKEWSNTRKFVMKLRPKRQYKPPTNTFRKSMHDIMNIEKPLR